MKKRTLAILISAITFSSHSIAGVSVDYGAPKSQNIHIGTSAIDADRLTEAQEISENQTQKHLKENESKSVADKEGVSNNTSDGLSEVAGNNSINESQKSMSEDPLTLDAVIMTNPDWISEDHFGHRVPLEMTLKQLVPEGWTINIQESVKEQIVNWRGGKTWPEVVRSIKGEFASISTHVNQDDMIVGVGSNPKLAEHMAKVVPTVWFLDPKETVRKNVIRWAHNAGWEVDWLADVNYKLETEAYIAGDFYGRDGAIHQLMKALSTKDKPLHAVFKVDDFGNRTVVIKNFKRKMNSIDQSEKQRLEPYRIDEARIAEELKAEKNNSVDNADH